MPQKGQITKHEWFLHHIDAQGDEIQRCAYCPVRKRINQEGIELYGTSQDGWYEEEPPCITRKIQADEM